MPKINELPRASTLAATDLLAKDNTSGTSTEGVSAQQVADFVKGTIPAPDSAPTTGSTNTVTSGGVKTALDAKQNSLTFDSTPTAGSNNPVTSAGIKTALDAKQNTLTFDNIPTNGSNNPVKSDGVFDADEAIRGQVADLKTQLTENNPPDVTWEIGGFTSTGATTSTQKYCIKNTGTNAIKIVSNGSIGCQPGYRIKVLKYTSNIMNVENMLSNTGWTTDAVTVNEGDYIGIALMYGTDTTQVLSDTTISENIILTFITVRINDGTISKNKLSDDVKTVLNEAEELLPDVVENTKYIAELEEIIEMPDSVNPNTAYVSSGIDATHYGLTWVKKSDLELALYGTSTGAAFLNVLNGANEYSNAGAETPAKNIEHGAYVIDFVVPANNSVEVCYTESTYGNRISLTKKQILFVGENGGCIFYRARGNNYGTEETPTIITTSITEATYNHSPYNIYKSDFNGWYSGLNGNYDAYGFSWNTKYADVITLFDALVTAHPEYITKTALGTGSGTDANGQPYTIYEYAFVPKIKKSNYNKRRIPKLLMDGCIHGFEKNSTLGLYCFLKDVCENWQDNNILEYIRNFIELRVVPVSNPWGFDNNDRRNYNGVNLNRNFPCPGWTASDESGVEPLDQPESKILADWIKSNGDMLYYLNIHTNGMYNASAWGEANFCMTSSDRNDSYFNRIFPVFCKHITQQTYKFSEMYNIDFGDAFFGNIHVENSSDSGKGAVQIYCHTYLGSVMGMTLEVFNGVSIDGVSQIAVLSPQSTKMCSEIIGNIIAQILCEFAE